MIYDTYFLLFWNISNIISFETYKLTICPLGQISTTKNIVYQKLKHSFFIQIADISTIKINNKIKEVQPLGDLAKRVK